MVLIGRFSKAGPSRLELDCDGSYLGRGHGLPMGGPSASQDQTNHERQRWRRIPGTWTEEEPDCRELNRGQLAGIAGGERESGWG